MASAVMRRGLRSIEAVLAGVLAVVIVVAHTARPAGSMGALAVDLLLCAAAGLSVRSPRWSAAAVTVILLVLLVAQPGWRSLGEYAAWIPVLGAGMRGAHRDRAIMSVVLVAVLSAFAFVESRDLAETAWYAVFWVALFALVWVLGSMVARMAASARRDRQQALVLQRQDIARDLHDTVSHGLAQMVMRAERAKLAGGAGLDDLDFIIATGSRSVTELRAMMRLMRGEDDHAERQPSSQPGGVWRIASLGEVLRECVDDLTARGFGVSSVVEGDLDRVPRPAADTLAKIARESTSNVIKHGDRSGPVAMLCSVEEASVHLVVTNSPAGARGRLDVEPLGVLGMKERAAVMGGSVEAGMGASQWMVRASLPWDAATAVAR